MQKTTQTLQQQLQNFRFVKMQQALLGEKSVEDAMKEAQAKIDPIVAEDPLPDLSTGGGVADDVNK